MRLLGEEWTAGRRSPTPLFSRSQQQQQQQQQQLLVKDFVFTRFPVFRRCWTHHPHLTPILIIILHSRHFTIRGADQTDFAGGVYHGRILLPPEYPYKPPHIIFLTPTGRFDINTKICLSFSAFHPELWQPAWGIRLILEALISFLPTPADGAIGALDWSAEERRKLAVKSQNFHCPCCGPIVNLLPKLKVGTSDIASGASSSKPSRFQKEIEQLQLLQQQEHQKGPDDDKKETTETVAQDQDQESAAAATIDDPDQDDVVTDTAPPLDTDGESSKEARQLDDGTNDATGEALPFTGKEEEATQQPQPAEPPAATLQPLSPTNATLRRRRAEPASHPATLNAPPAAAGAAAAGAAAAGAAAPEVAVVAGPQDSGLWDPLLQATIALLSVICYLLWRKVQALWEELQDLDQ